MNLNINNTVISSMYPIDSIRGISNRDNTYHRDLYIPAITDTELPLFLCCKNQLCTYDYASRTYKSIWSLTGDVNTVDKLILRSWDTPVRSLNDKFYTCFRDFGGLKKCTITNKSYYAGKGIITDEFFNPVILTTYKVSNYDMLQFTEERNSRTNAKIDQTKLKVYLSRSLFHPNFYSNNKKIHKEIFSIILPELMTLQIPVTIKTELNMFNFVYIDAKLNFNQLQDKFKVEGDEAIRNLIRRIQ